MHTKFVIIPHIHTTPPRQKKKLLRVFNKIYGRHAVMQHIT
jgi:hypothetical protein